MIPVNQILIKNTRFKHFCVVVASYIYIYIWTTRIYILIVYWLSVKLTSIRAWFSIFMDENIIIIKEKAEEDEKMCRRKIIKQWCAAAAVAIWRTCGVHRIVLACLGFYLFRYDIIRDTFIFTCKSFLTLTFYLYLRWLVFVMKNWTEKSLILL